MPTASSQRRSSGMERGKRASMREGPLAALFRKTEEEGLEEKPAPQKPEEPKRAQRNGSGQTPEPRGGRPIPAPDHSQEPLESGDPRLEQLRPAPPSARTEPAVEPEPEERRARSPEERLRQVFSHDIPENIMELSPSSDRDVP